METIPFLTKEDVTALDTILNDYLQKSNGTLCIVIDKGGTVIAQNGEIGTIDITTIAALAAGSFAATKELARRIGESEFSALYHQGKSQHIFMSALDEYTIIITVFGEKTTVGLIRFYTVNVSSQLAALLESLRQREESGPEHQFLISDTVENGSVPANKIFV
jgi:predicted regulator of Ras-like GTPase activity (Roadblock/LC7/MglB family)